MQNEEAPACRSILQFHRERRDDEDRAASEHEDARWSTSHPSRRDSRQFRIGEVVLPHRDRFDEEKATLESLRCRKNAAIPRHVLSWLLANDRSASRPTVPGSDEGSWETAEKGGVISPATSRCKPFARSLRATRSTMCMTSLSRMPWKA